VGLPDAELGMQEIPENIPRAKMMMVMATTV
jgi:hypothetical protein